MAARHAGLFVDHLEGKVVIANGSNYLFRSTVITSLALVQYVMLWLALIMVYERANPCANCQQCNLAHWQPVTMALLTRLRCHLGVIVPEPTDVLGPGAHADKVMNLTVADETLLGTVALRVATKPAAGAKAKFGALMIHLSTLFGTMGPRNVSSSSWTSLIQNCGIRLNGSLHKHRACRHRCTQALQWWLLCITHTTCPLSLQRHRASSTVPVQCILSTDWL